MRSRGTGPRATVKGDDFGSARDSTRATLKGDDFGSARDSTRATLKGTIDAWRGTGPRPTVEEESWLGEGQALTLR